MIQSFFNEAALIGDNKTKLKKRLLRARSVLKTEYRKTFKTFTFDFEAKRLYNQDLSYALQWENNGITTVGECSLIEIGC